MFSNANERSRYQANSYQYEHSLACLHKNQFVLEQYDTNGYHAEDQARLDDILSLNLNTIGPEDILKRKSYLVIFELSSTDQCVQLLEFLDKLPAWTVRSSSLGDPDSARRSIIKQFVIIKELRSKSDSQSMFNWGSYYKVEWTAVGYKITNLKGDNFQGYNGLHWWLPGEVPYHLEEQGKVICVNSSSKTTLKALHRFVNTHRYVIAKASSLEEEIQQKLTAFKFIVKLEGIKISFECWDNNFIKELKELPNNYNCSQEDTSVTLAFNLSEVRSDKLLDFLNKHREKIENSSAIFSNVAAVFREMARREQSEISRRPREREEQRLNANEINREGVSIKELRAILLRPHIRIRPNKGNNLLPPQFILDGFNLVFGCIISGAKIAIDTTSTITNRATASLSATTHWLWTTLQSATPVVQPTEIPDDYLCPISLQPMDDPVTLPSGITCNRSSLTKMRSVTKKLICPMTRKDCTSFDERNAGSAILVKNTITEFFNQNPHLKPDSGQQVRL